MVTLSFSEAIMAGLEQERAKACELNNLRLYRIAQGLLWVGEGKALEEIARHREAGRERQQCKNERGRIIDAAADDGRERSVEIEVVPLEHGAERGGKNHPPACFVDAFSKLIGLKTGNYR